MNDLVRFGSFLASVALMLAGCPSSMKPSPQYYARLRQTMVREQIQARGIRDQRVLDAMRAVPRHLFVPEAYRHESYADYPVPIGQGQTISQPFIVAQMTELLELTGNERVLEIGTGSGYQAAILSLLAAEVYTIELLEPLATAAAQRLTQLGYENVHVRCGDGYLGWTEAQPFDAIVVTAAPEELPDSLVAQLRDGGRLVVPLGEEGAVQILTLFTKQGDSLIRTDIEPVRFVPMRHGAPEGK